MNVVLLSRDLMLLAHTQGAANKVETTLRNATSDKQAIEWVADHECCGLLVDLRAPGLQIGGLVAAVREIRGADFAIVACGPHVHERALNAAREAGCTLVVTRGQFDRDAEAILTSLLAKK